MQNGDNVLEGYDGVEPCRYSSSEADDVPLLGCAFRDLYAECSLRSGTTGRPLCDALRTSYKSHTSDGETMKHQWDEWIVFPVKYLELPSDAVLCVTVWDAYSPRTKCCIGGVTAPIVGQRKGKIKAGIRQVHMWSHRAADLRVSSELEPGVSLGGDTVLRSTTPGQLKVLTERSRLENELRHYGSKPLNWLDQLTFKRSQEMSQSSKREDGKLLLNVELRSFDHPVIFPHMLIRNSAAVPLSLSGGRVGAQQAGAKPRTKTQVVSAGGAQGGGTGTGANSGQYQRRHTFEYRRPGDQMADQWIEDSEVDQSNLVEEKHLKMTLYVSDPTLDKELKPNSTEMRRIKDDILDAPPLHEFSLEDKKLLWKFRYYLSSNKKALVKFLRSIDWSYAKEAKEATMLLEQWAEVDTVDALLLLSRFFINAEPVRRYAVDVLSKADDDTLLDVLLQLVQALRYEADGEHGALAQMLMDRAAMNFEIANNLNWFLVVESEDKKYGDLFKNVHHQLWVQLKKKGSDLFLERLIRQKRLVDALQLLGKQLKQDKDSRPKKIVKLKKQLAVKGAPWHWSDILFGNISNKFPPTPLALPLNPNIEAVGFVAEEANIFKSAMNPLLLPFRVAAHAPETPVAATATATATTSATATATPTAAGEESLMAGTPSSQSHAHADEQHATHAASPHATGQRTYNTIYKHGDDMRQDQLVIQLITLMDKLLKKNGLDLKLTPYRVLATSSESGFAHCVTPSTGMSKIARGDVRAWLKKCNQASPEDYHTACQNFVKSCAGYCVITYILGVGDRHLDNILVTPDGRLFHIDFGFMLGRDPKPFPPPCKLCKEMVEGMGGRLSEGYQKFMELCCTAYNILRRHADLIISLFVLMVDANIPDIEHGTVDPIRNINKVQDKFKLDMSDAEAMQFFMQILLESERALFPQITEMLHAWAQYWRA